jgi:YggT family protein
MLITLIQLLQLASQLLVTIVIVQFILSLLIMFNVVSQSNQFVGGLYSALNSLLDPLLRPIRKILPDTGMMDFSPIVLIFGIQAVIIILANIAQSGAAL